ncbi:alkB [Acrasis kona]|uniref:AlkB n=1 Tax=Acrasis kona TaxID=1008807 RepID=A0AAW2YGN9_9EUKA
MLTTQAMMAPQPTQDAEENVYRVVERIYKQHYYTPPNRTKPVAMPLPDLSKVVDFEASHPNLFEIDLKENQHYIDSLQAYNRECSGLDLPPLEQWRVYGLKGYDGFMYIRRLIAPEQQYYWMERCIKDYPNPPNITNLKALYGDDAGTDLWLRRKEPDSMLNKLAWCTLGYQYDWTPRKYHKQQPVAFPPDIASLTTLVAHATGSGPYLPEAAIVNYYKKDGNMGGHLDNAEYEMKKPIVSISFGCDAIFLLGGETRAIEPIPLLLRSGDVMIMGGRSRYCYHGIARVMSDNTPEHIKHCEQEEYKDLCSYMKGRRLNINTRQVFERE